ncbi:acetyltransferase (GNAT) family [Clostridium pasteurianum DSM 525 = ATCC 6013]|uniref:Acetyltransferase (GNAT) family n=1 Tax=Clostridium pasteurianum DSM 525 = ATCC 6013 TaxID=1262449 RepID=A0A0H3J3I1_CLOPA|nr:GNAT family N-acetyltransferase [Clostridium pasteurianum]AJA48019.1 acetyltransferase (GNAT) family [Clostridium pasteurianum DSM 525 = ATCC 6013]AJA52007.1 acetyltransferase (GNAT) family [Clostridium pasteurianum DSM 525 = ATCC 6013]AOZ75302.1 acetyltransferase [Clostridium pasteurianum DSM 525 = ATCC 6013]AOZ79097.1 acetyltransferase [Clostridium pasteurianum]ELP59922.1 GNAT family acetyltransferase [Clostridium pasteurianum DSM 525 = ATCC 6013]
MYNCIDLNKTNIYNLKKLTAFSPKFNNLNKDFFNIYDNSNFIQKHFQRKRVKILNYGEESIGYIWTTNNFRAVYTIEAMSVVSNNNLNLKKCYEKLLHSVSNKGVFIYECEKNDYNFKTLKDIGFKILNGTLEMKCNLDREYNFNVKGDIVIENLVLNRDEKKRCAIQNAIFKKDGRTPLTVEDIYFDQCQNYYFDKGCFFIKLKGFVIGYGQIIINDGIPVIVNFGILENFRGKGYGRLFLLFLISKAKQQKFREIFIRVDSSNTIAFNLYRSVGFEIEKEICTWKFKS